MERPIGNQYHGMDAIEPGRLQFVPDELPKLKLRDLQSFLANAAYGLQLSLRAEGSHVARPAIESLNGLRGSQWDPLRGIVFR